MGQSRTVAVIGGVLAGVLLALCLSQLVGVSDVDTPSAWLASDVDGRLREICVHYRQDFNEESIEVLSDLFASLPTDVTVHVVVADHAEFAFLQSELASRGIGAGLRMRPLVTGMPITPWAKDRFGTMRDGDTPVIALPGVRTMLSGARANDERVPELICDRLSRVRAKVLPFHFEGGDLISDATNVYVAATLLDRNQPTTVLERQRLISLIETTFKKHAVVIGESGAEVPDHHIGMYLTPLGNSTVALGDPDMGRRLCRELGIAESVELESDESAYEPFRNVIRVMQTQGFKIVRVPLVLTTTPRVYLTYNNAILESDAGHKRIYMPVYGVTALDRAATRIFQQQGLTVLPVRVGKIYRHTGSLRCLVGIIDRA